MPKQLDRYLDKRIDIRLVKEDAARHAVTGKNMEWALDQGVISRSEAAAMGRIKKSMRDGGNSGRIDKQMVQEMIYRLLVKYNLDVKKEKLFLKPREPEKLKKFLKRFERY